jgi:CxxC motif-containing protein
MEKPTEKKSKTRRKAEKPLDREKAKRYTCIVCPACCDLETDGTDVNGARCPKGEAFARQEVIMPLRLITTTVRCEISKGTKLLPVKTSCPIPLSRVPEMMRQIKALRLSEIPAIGTRLTTGSASEPVEWVVTGELV